MRILVVAATRLEIAPLLAQLGPTSRTQTELEGYTKGAHTIDVVLSGVGMVATAVHSSRAMGRTPYDAALNFGVCGSFDPALTPGTVVHVVADRIAELGAEDGDRFLPFGDLQLPGDDQFVNPRPLDNLTLAALPSVTGVTVNTVHGNEASIAAVVSRFHPQVESMEGAAFMSACLIHKIQFAQVRAVSNLVERRNRAAWKMAEAIRQLSDTALQILDQA